MIKKILSNAMLSIVMDKSAKEKFQAVRENRKAMKEGGKTASEAQQTTAGDAPETGASEGLDRQELIRNALAVHKEQSKVLDNLGENERRKLQLLALHTMMGKGGRET